jgi:hypothetical protein
VSDDALPASRWPEWLVGAVVVAALVLSASTFPMYIDEGIWNHVARGWVVDGQPFYQGPVENKTPGIFYVFGLSYWLFGQGHAFPRALGIVAILACCATVYALGRRISDRVAALTAVLVLGLATSSRVVDGPETAMTESFMLAFTTLAVYHVEVAVTGGTRRRWRMLGAGLLLGLAIAFKQIAVITALVLPLWAWMRAPAAERSGRQWRADMLLIVAGCVLATAASIAPLLLAGVTLEEYWRGAWLILLDPGTGAESLAERIERFQKRFVHPVSSMVYTVGLFALAGGRLGAAGVPWRLLLAWFGLDAIGAAASGRFHGHHFRQFFPEASLAVGALTSLVVNQVAAWGFVRARRAAAVLLTALALTLVPQRAVWALLGEPQRLPRLRVMESVLAAWVRDNTTPDDYIYSWTSGGTVHGVTRRRSSSRYFNSNFVHAPEAIEEVQRDLQARPPRMVIVEREPPCWITLYLASCCRLVIRTITTDVWERVPAGSPAAGVPALGPEDVDGCPAYRPPGADAARPVVTSR